MNADKAHELARIHGWADAIARIVDEAPPVPDAAVDLLIAAGFPTGNHKREKAS